ncbi:MAG: polysaccharide deacetylase family protein [Pseudomonadota bacterium]
MLYSIRPKIAVLYIARLLGMFALARRLTGYRLRILCYHGGCIGDELGYNPKLFCSTETFRKRVDWLARKSFRFVSLDHATRTPAGQRKRLETVITFDDGWYSTGHALLPVLAERRIPSTLYLCTQHYLEGWPVLNVTTRYLVWKAPRKTVQLSEFGRDVDGAHDLNDATTRENLARAFVAVLSPHADSRATVCAALERFGAALGVDAGALALDSRRFEYMRPEEVRQAAASGCAIELHGHQHVYPLGDPLRFRADLKRCDEVITEIGLPKPRHYCYPSGSFDQGAAAVLAESDIASATTCIPGLARDTAVPAVYYLPRFLDGESIHPLEFEAEMSGFADFLRRCVGLVKR